MGTVQSTLQTRARRFVRLENSKVPLEKFAALDRLGCRYGFVCRVPGIDGSDDKAEVLANLDSVHHEIRRQLGLGAYTLATARQVHGHEVATIDLPLKNARCFEGCDALITNQSNVCLGIYVADCCAVYLVDRRKRAVGLAHSGKKGTELRIVENAIRALRDKFFVQPTDLVVQLSPCIRPPHYEVDFAAEIVRQCRLAGVQEIHDSGLCTACDLNRYYSYRAEKGKTGRMLALIAL